MLSEQEKLQGKILMWKILSEELGNELSSACYMEGYIQGIIKDNVQGIIKENESKKKTR